MNNKANTLKRCGFRAAMVNILKRGSFHREGGTSNAAPRSRHQKKALCFQTEHPVPHTRRGREYQQSVGVLEEATAGSAAPPAGAEGDYLLSRVHTFRCFTYISLLLLIQLKATLLRLDSLVLSGQLLHGFFSTHRENTETFPRMDMKHWNATLPTTDKINRGRSDCQISTKLSRVSDCCCSTFLPLVFHFSPSFSFSFFSVV